MSTQLPSDILDRNGLAEYLAEQDSLLEVYGGEVFEPYLWVRGDRKMMGDDVLKERDNHSDYCIGCEICWPEGLEWEGDI